MNFLECLVILQEKYKSIQFSAKFWNKISVDEHNEWKSDQGTSTDITIDLASSIKYC